MFGPSHPRCPSNQDSAKVLPRAKGYIVIHPSIRPSICLPTHPSIGPSILPSIYYTIVLSKKKNVHPTSKFPLYPLSQDIFIIKPGLQNPCGIDRHGIGEFEARTPQGYLGRRSVLESGFCWIVSYWLWPPFLPQLSCQANKTSHPSTEPEKQAASAEDCRAALLHTAGSMFFFF